jgi:hypothetical protein
MILRQLNHFHKQQFSLFVLLGFYAAYMLVFTDVSGQPVGYIFKGQAVFLDCLTFQMGPRGCPETSGINYQSTLRKFPEERILLSQEQFESYPTLQHINLPLLLVFFH